MVLGFVNCCGVKRCSCTCNSSISSINSSLACDRGTVFLAALAWEGPASKDTSGLHWRYLSHSWYETNSFNFFFRDNTMGFVFVGSQVLLFCCFVGFFCLSADIPCTPLLFLIYPAFYLCFLYLSLCQDFTANVDNQSYTKPIMRTHESNVLLVISFCFSFWEPQQKFQRKHILPCGKFGSSAIS